MGQNDLTGSKIMIADELRILFDDLRSDIAALKLDVMLISHDVAKIREQLDKLEREPKQPQESIGIAPNTPPPDFLPPELM